MAVSIYNGMGGNGPLDPCVVLDPQFEFVGWTAGMISGMPKGYIDIDSDLSFQSGIPTVNGFVFQQWHAIGQDLDAPGFPIFAPAPLHCSGSSGLEAQSD